MKKIWYTPNKFEAYGEEEIKAELERYQVKKIDKDMIGKKREIAKEKLEKAHEAFQKAEEKYKEAKKDFDEAKGKFNAVVNQIKECETENGQD